jgi:hypothetical protein
LGEFFSQNLIFSRNHLIKLGEGTYKKVLRRRGKAMGDESGGGARASSEEAELKQRRATNQTNHQREAESEETVMH